MKRPFLIAVVFAAIGVCSCAIGLRAQEGPVEKDRVVLETYSQLDFESIPTGELPVKWMKKGRDEFKAEVIEGGTKFGSRCLRISSAIAGPEGQPSGMVNRRCEPDMFRGKRMRFKVSLRAELEGDGTALLWLREDLKSGDPGAFDNMQDRPIVSCDWTEYEIVADISEDAKSIAIGLIVLGKGNVFVDNLRIQVVNESVEPTVSARAASPLGEDVFPGLFEIKGSMQVRRNPAHPIGDEDSVELLMPLPMLYRDQYPLTYNLATKPAECLKSVRIYEDKPGNYVAAVTLSSWRDRKFVDVVFNSAVMVAPSSIGSVPSEAKIPVSWPKQSQQWLKSTWCVDSENARIQEIARQIRANTDDVLQIIAEVETRTKKILGAASGNVKNLIAVEALDKRGSCTSNGNLVAALLRASEVPARVLAGYPSWSGPLQTHYMVEAYVPNYGWYPIESTLCRSPWTNEKQVNVAIVPPEYESEAMAGLRTGVIGGVPYLSLTEVSNNNGQFYTFGNLPEKLYCDHVCNFVRKFEGKQAEWDKTITMAGKRWANWLKSEPQVAAGTLSFGPDSREIEADSLSKLSQELSVRK